jgi:hypothetical protein
VFFSFLGSQEAGSVDGQYSLGDRRTGVEPRQRRPKVAGNHRQVRQHPQEEKQICQLCSGDDGFVPSKSYQLSFEFILHILNQLVYLFKNQSFFFFFAIIRSVGVPYP